MSVDLDAICALDGHDQAALVRTGEVPPTALVEAALARISALNPTLNAVSHVAADHAMAAASRADRTAPMAAVPYLLKASMEYPGFPWVSGSRACINRVGQNRYPFAAAMDAAGLVPCGMSTMPEFGLIGTGTGSTGKNGLASIIDIDGQHGLAFPEKGFMAVHRRQSRELERKAHQKRASWPQVARLSYPCVLCVLSHKD